MTMSKEMTPILSCHGCNDVYADEVYQCSNGHGFCKTCVNNLIRDSSDCSMCYGTLLSNGRFIRNLGLEKVADLITVPCRYKFLR